MSAPTRKGRNGDGYFPGEAPGRSVNKVSARKKTGKRTACGKPIGSSGYLTAVCGQMGLLCLKCEPPKPDPIEQQAEAVYAALSDARLLCAFCSRVQAKSEVIAAIRKELRKL